MPFAGTRTDLETVILSAINQTQTDQCHIISLIHGALKKKGGTSELIYTTEVESQM